MSELPYFLFEAPLPSAPGAVHFDVSRLHSIRYVPRHAIDHVHLAAAPPMSKQEAQQALASIRFFHSFSSVTLTAEPAASSSASSIPTAIYPKILRMSSRSAIVDQPLVLDDDAADGVPAIRFLRAGLAAAVGPRRRAEAVELHDGLRTVEVVRTPLLLQDEDAAVRQLLQHEVDTPGLHVTRTLVRAEASQKIIDVLPELRAAGRMGRRVTHVSRVKFPLHCSPSHS